MMQQERWNMDSNSKSNPWKRLTTLAASAALTLFLAPPASALEIDEPGSSAVRVPDAIQALSSGLLGFGVDPTVSVCNTVAIDGTTVVGLETWYGAGSAGTWTEAAHNGTAVAVEMLERFLFEHQGEGFAEDMGETMKNCSRGGFCACVAIVTTLTGYKAVACSVCCGEGSLPFCSCDG